MVLNRLRRRASGDSGVSLIIVALCMVGILGVAAIVVDLGNARQIRRELQGGVDAASLAGAQDLPLPRTTPPPGSPSRARPARRRPTTPPATWWARRRSAPTARSRPASPAPARSAAWPSPSPRPGTRRPTRCRPTPTRRPTSGTSTCRRARTRRPSSPGWCSRAAPGCAAVRSAATPPPAVASTTASWPPNPTKCAALTFAGNSDTILTSNGAVMVNSNCASGNAQALDSSGSSWQLKFLDGSTEVPGFIGVVGGATLAPCDPVTQTNKCTQTVPTTGISPFGDPLSGLIAPTKPAGAAKTCPQNGGGAITPGYFSDCTCQQRRHHHGARDLLARRQLQHERRQPDLRRRWRVRRAPATASSST